MNKAPLIAVLSMGFSSYCLMLFVSMDAPIIPILFMGCVSIFLIFISIYFLWHSKHDDKSEEGRQFTENHESEVQSTKEPSHVSKD